jgi:hypothetical protein
MAEDSVVIKLDGKVSAADFRTVVDAFVDLMYALTAEAGAGAAVEWFISDLSGGSARIVSRAEAGNAEGEYTRDRVVDRYKEVALDAAEGRLSRYSDRIRENVRTITSVVNGKIPRVLMGTPEQPELGKIDRPIPPEEAEQAVEPTMVEKSPVEPRSYTRAAVKGRIVLLEDKQGISFTLQEAYGGRYIRCYPGDRFRELLGECWKKKNTSIIVEGRYVRYGTHPTLTEITDIVPLPEGTKGGWRQAVGAAPRDPDSQNISSAEAVRRVRDANT